MRHTRYVTWPTSVSTWCRSEPLLGSWNARLKSRCGDSFSREMDDRDPQLQSRLCRNIASSTQVESSCTIHHIDFSLGSTRKIFDPDSRPDLSASRVNEIPIVPCGQSAPHLFSASGAVRRIFSVHASLICARAQARSEKLSSVTHSDELLNANLFQQASDDSRIRYMTASGTSLSSATERKEGRYILGRLNLHVLTSICNFEKHPIDTLPSKEHSKHVPQLSAVFQVKISTWPHILPRWTSTIFDIFSISVPEDGDRGACYVWQKDYPCYSRAAMRSDGWRNRRPLLDTIFYGPKSSNCS